MFQPENIYPVDRFIGEWRPQPNKATKLFPLEEVIRCLTYPLRNATIEAHKAAKAILDSRQNWIELPLPMMVISKTQETEKFVPP